MSYIVETIIGDRRIQLTCEEIVRPILLGGSNWTKLRIGIRCAVWYSGGNLPGTCLSVGLSQTADAFLSTNTVDMLGFLCQNGTTNTWTLTTTSVPFCYTGGGILYYQKVGTTVTSLAATNTTGPFIVADPTAYYSNFFVEITKGSPNYTMAMWAANSFANGQISVSTRDTFYLTLENEAAPTNMTNLFNLSTSSYTGTGNLSYLSVYWNRATPSLEITDIAVCRFV